MNTPVRTPQRAQERNPTKEPIREEGWPEGFSFYEPSLDKFALDISKKPEGMSYEWHAVTILGKENTQQLVNWERNRWTPVPASRHPEIGGEPIPKESRFASSGGIKVEDQMLFERPQVITDYARALERKAATDMVNNQFKRLKLAPEGTLSDGGKRTITEFQRTFERSTGPSQAVPDDE